MENELLEKLKTPEGLAVLAEILKDNLRLSIDRKFEYDFGSYYNVIELKLMFADQEVFNFIWKNN